MGLKTIAMEPKQPWEIVGYVWNWKKVVPSTDTITGVAYVVYNDTDSPSSFTDLSSTMIFASDFDATAFTTECDVQAGTDGETYVLRGRVTCNSGQRYEQDGKFSVKETG